MPTIVEELESPKQPIDTRVTPRINQELVTLYRIRKAENRPRDKGLRFHLRDEEFKDCLLEAELNQLGSTRSPSPIVNTLVYRREPRAAVSRKDLGLGVSSTVVDECEVLG